VEHRSFITSELAFIQPARTLFLLEVMKRNLGRRKPASSRRAAPFFLTRRAGFSRITPSKTPRHTRYRGKVPSHFAHHPSLSPLVTRVHLFHPPSLSTCALSSRSREAVLLFHSEFLNKICRPSRESILPRPFSIRIVSYSYPRVLKV